MDRAVDFFIRQACAMQAAGWLVVVVAALVHFRCCDWRVSLPSQKGRSGGVELTPHRGSNLPRRIVSWKRQGSGRVGGDGAGIVGSRRSFWHYMV
jgi:hypothetical protein